MANNLNLPYCRLFILGAGFSKPAGLPLGEELLEGVRDTIHRFFLSEGGWEGTLEQEIEEWTALYPDAPLNLERVLAYSHRKHYLRLLGSDEYFAHGSRTIVAARKAIQKILIEATPRTTPALYLKFAERLSPNDVVLTFNYDTLLEQALDNIGKPYSMTPEWWFNQNAPVIGQEYVDVLKLHGSTDWYDRRYYDEVRGRYAEESVDVRDRDPIFGPNPSVPHEPLSRGPTDGRGNNILSRVFRVPDHADYFPIEAGLLGWTVVPFILPPAYDKLLGYDAILDLWEDLHRTPATFSSVVIVGYSMPPYDSYAYEALGRLLIEYQQEGDRTFWGQRRVPTQLVTLADSKEDALKNVPFLDPDQTRVWHEGFSQDCLDWLEWGDGDEPS